MIRLKKQLTLLSSRSKDPLGTHHSRGRVDDLLCLQIALVADQQLVDVLAGIAFDFLQPRFDVVERFLVGAVVHHDDTVRTPVVRRRYRTEALLAGGVPLLKRKWGQWY